MTCIVQLNPARLVATHGLRAAVGKPKAPELPQLAPERLVCTCGLNVAGGIKPRPLSADLARLA